MRVCVQEAGEQREILYLILSYFHYCQLIIVAVKVKVSIQQIICQLRRANQNQNSLYRLLKIVQQHCRIPEIRTKMRAADRTAGSDLCKPLIYI